LEVGEGVGVADAPALGVEDVVTTGRGVADGEFHALVLGEGVGDGVVVAAVESGTIAIITVSAIKAARILLKGSNRRFITASS